MSKIGIWFDISLQRFFVNTRVIQMDKWNHICLLVCLRVCVHITIDHVWRLSILGRGRPRCIETISLMFQKGNDWWCWTTVKWYCSLRSRLMLTIVIIICVRKRKPFFSSPSSYRRAQNRLIVIIASPQTHWFASPSSSLRRRLLFAFVGAYCRIIVSICHWSGWCLRPCCCAHAI